MMKKILSLLLALCLLLGAALAETVALPEIGIALDEKTTLEKEETAEGYGWVRQYARETSALYVMLMKAAVTADEMMGSIETSNLQVTTLIADEGGVKERRVYSSETDNMAVDVAVVASGDYSVVLMLMSEVSTYFAGGQQALMDGWLESLTIDGAPVVTDVAAAITATETKLAQQAAETEQQIADGELVAIPRVGISFGGEGVLVDESGVENAFMQTYQVGSQTVFIMAYLGEYLCDGVWQSLTFELPENQLIAEEENGIRQRKTFDYGDYTGDVTVVWKRGCTVAMVVVAPDADYEAGMADTITGWLQSMTIDGEKVIVSEK